MPLYRLICDTCQHEEDVFRRVAQIDDLLPVCCAMAMRRKVCAPFVQGDQAAYQAVAVDQKTGRAPRIEGRAQHREFLRRNGYVEVGNDIPKPRTEVKGDFNVRRELVEATRAVLSQPGHVK
jgi:hypothetical protein